MNDQEEKILSQSKWSGRRMVLFYWFALVFLGTSAAAGLGTTILLPNYKIEQDPHESIAEPWGPDDCVACHAEEVYGWETTWHAQLVGEYDPTDITLNGSRMSYNSTHFWRTPQITTFPPQYWTYNQIFNASGQQCCMTTRWTNTTLINSTTGEVLWYDADLVAQYGGNIWDIGISCAACHTNPGEFSLSYTTCSRCHIPGGRQWIGYIDSAHYNSLNDLLASSDPQTLQYEDWTYVGQTTYMSLSEIDESDYYRITCATCHDMHNATINTGEDSTVMSPWTNPYTGQVFGPGGSQLRAATINELCGICHDTNLTTTTGSYIDPSDHTVLDCTDCHGYTYAPTTYFENGTINTNSSVSALSHDWNFDFGETGCGVCHGENAKDVYSTMLEYQDNYLNNSDMRYSYEMKLDEAMYAYETANHTLGADVNLLNNAYSLIEEAEVLALGTSITFHNPEQGLDIERDQLSLALTKLDYAIQDAINALPEPQTTGPVTYTTTVTEPVTYTTTVPGVTTPISSSAETTTEESTTTTTYSIPTISSTTGFSAYIVFFLLIISIPLIKRRKR